MNKSQYLSILSIILFVLHNVEAIKKGSSIPADWVPRVEGGNMLFTVDEPNDVNMMGSVGNGYVATVVSSNTIYIGGVFNGLNSIGPSHRARVPATNAISIPSVTPVGSAMDVELGIFYRRSLLTVGSCVVPIEQRWYAHRVNRYLLIHEIDVNATECSQSVTVPLDNIPFVASTDINFATVPSNLGPNVVVYQGAINTTEEPNGEVVYVGYVTPVIPDEISVSANQFETFYYISAFRTSLDTDSDTPASEAQQVYSNAVSQQESLLESHIAQMMQVLRSRIEVWGDVDLAAAINSSMYYIVSSIRDDWPFHLSPGGLSSNSYNGHSFWDGETWMYPSLLMLHPELAQSMIEYRFNRMQGAEEKAQSYDAGYKGTMFPWESAFTGEEVCPTSAPTGQLEQHISGDIAFALWQYWSVTQNVTWLKTYGWPLFQGIAEFWTSRVSIQNGQYVINGVIPPDEYAVNVNNSVYTNVVAQYSLMFASTVGELLGQPVPPEWLKIASGIVIPFDETEQIHPEYDGYNGQTIKQADVVLLGFPLMYPMSTTVRYNDLVYYSARTDPNGPAMTYGMQAVALLELGYPENATAEFKRSYANIQEPFDVWTETPTGGAINFITGAGGFLQGVMFGYGGLRIKPGYLHWNPILPEGVTEMRFAGVNYVGNIFDFQFNSTDISVTLQDVIEGASLLYLENGNSKTVLPLYTPVTISVGPCQIVV